MSEELQQQIDDLTEQLEEKDEKIQELEQEVSDQSDEISAIANDQKDYDDAISEHVVVAEGAFYAGRESKEESTLKGWLNYKVEARL